MIFFLIFWCQNVNIHGTSLSLGLLSGHLDSMFIFITTAPKLISEAMFSFLSQTGDETVVAGMVDGLVSISRHEEETRPTKQERKKVSYRYAPDGFQATSVDAVVREEKMDLISKHDVCLRKFQYSKAVDCVLMSYITNKKPAVTVCVFQELIRYESRF